MENISGYARLSGEFLRFLVDAKETGNGRRPDYPLAAR